MKDHSSEFQNQEPDISSLPEEARSLVHTFTTVFGVSAGLRIQKMLIESPSFLSTMTQDNDGGQFSYNYNEAYADGSEDDWSDLGSDNYSNVNFQSPDVSKLKSVHQFMPIIKDVVQHYPLLDAGVIARLIFRESGGKSAAKHASGAQGLAQITSGFLADYCKNAKIDPKSIDLNDPKTNIEITCFNLSRILKRDANQSYLKKQPNQRGFVTYINHHDGVGGGPKTLALFEKYGAHITESQFLSEIHNMADHYQTYVRPYRKYLEILQVAAFVNGEENNNSDLKYISNLKIAKHTKRKPDRSKLREAAFYDDTLFVGDSVMVGCKPYERQNSDTAEIGAFTKTIRSRVGDYDNSNGKTKAVVCVGHNDIVTMGNRPKDRSQRKSYMNRVDDFLEHYSDLISVLKSKGMKVVVMIPHLIKDQKYKSTGRRSQTRILNLLKGRIVDKHPDALILDHSDQSTHLHPGERYDDWREEYTAALESL